MAAPPLQPPQAPAVSYGRRSTGAKSRAFLASMNAAPDEAQQQNQQLSGSFAGASCCIVESPATANAPNGHGQLVEESAKPIRRHAAALRELPAPLGLHKQSAGSHKIPAIARSNARTQLSCSPQRGVR